MKIFKKVVVGLLLSVVLFSLPVNSVVLKANPTPEETMLSQINMIRVERGLNELTFSEDLKKGADIRVKESSSFFSHTRPDGTPWYTVDDITMGENLYKGAEQYALTAYVVEMWEKSPSHLDVMTSDFIQHAAISVCYVNGYYYVCLEVA